MAAKGSTLPDWVDDAWRQFRAVARARGFPALGESIEGRFADRWNDLDRLTWRPFLKRLRVGEFLHEERWPNVMRHAPAQVLLVAAVWALDWELLVVDDERERARRLLKVDDRLVEVLGEAVNLLHEREDIIESGGRGASCDDGCFDLWRALGSVVGRAEAFDMVSEHVGREFVRLGGESGVGAPDLADLLADVVDAAGEGGLRLRGLRIVSKALPTAIRVEDRRAKLPTAPSGVKHGSGGEWVRRFIESIEESFRHLRRPSDRLELEPVEALLTDRGIAALLSVGSGMDPDADIEDGEGFPARLVADIRRPLLARSAPKKRARVETKPREASATKARATWADPLGPAVKPD